MNLNDLITKRQHIKDERAMLSKRDSELAQELAELDIQLLDALDAQGTTNAAIISGGDRISVSVSEQTVPNVRDWETVNAYIENTGRFQLYERRMSSAAFRELLALEGAVPGVEPFTKRTINMQRRVAS